jgi:hypothetical protein
MEMVLDPSAARFGGRRSAGASARAPRASGAPADSARPSSTGLAPAKPEYQRYITGKTPRDGALRDYVFATPADPHQPEDVFGQLRWGGLYVFASRKRKQVVELSHRLENYVFALEAHPTYVRDGRSWLPFCHRKIHTLVGAQDAPAPARRNDRPLHLRRAAHAARERQRRQLVRAQAGAVARSHRRAPPQEIPDAPDATLERNARKFTEKIFPTFLTREAAMLMILEEHLPASYAKRVPRLIDAEKDERGFVRKLKMKWLPQRRRAAAAHGVRATKCGPLTRDPRHRARDSILICDSTTSSSRKRASASSISARPCASNEDLSRNPLLSSLFGELLRTSQIQP